MTSYEPKLHMCCLLAQYSDDLADYFTNRFRHRDRNRSSYKIEMRDINEWWKEELSAYSPGDARLIDNLPIDDGIDEWLDAFDDIIMEKILLHFSERRKRNGRRRSELRVE